MRDFRRLQIWTMSQHLAEEIYALTRRFPPDERFGLTAQMRRAAVSIPSNIAEGAGRNGVSEFRYHLGIAAGSANELESQLDLACRLQFVDGSDVERAVGLVGRVRRGIHGYIVAVSPKR